jgi:serine/threonine protein phosphatase PrpC
VRSAAICRSSSGPRATCAVCIVQGDSAYWAHIGDSRVYHLRSGRVLERTRDHSHVEFLLREGLISEEQVQPTRCAISSNAASAARSLLPEMT